MYNFFFLLCSELHTSQERYYAFSTHKLLFLQVFSRLKSRYQQRHVPLGRKFCRCGGPE